MIGDRRELKTRRGGGKNNGKFSMEQQMHGRKKRMSIVKYRDRELGHKCQTWFNHPQILMITCFRICGY